MIKEMTDETVKLMGQALDDIDVTDKYAYADFLAQTYYYVSHSTRLLAFAAGVMPQNEGQYFRRFIKHINEESNHEILAQKDLEELGFKLDDFYHKPETKALWEPQYYKILHEDPMSFMGYILALEQFACVYFPKFLEKIEKAYGGKATRFVKLHAEEDPDHVEKAIQFSESLSEERVQKVAENVLQTAKSYALICNNCVSNDKYTSSHIAPSRQIATHQGFNLG